MPSLSKDDITNTQYLTKCYKVVTVFPVSLTCWQKSLTITAQEEHPGPEEKGSLPLSRAGRQGPWGQLNQIIGLIGQSPFPPTPPPSSGTTVVLGVGKVCGGGAGAPRAEPTCHPAGSTAPTPGWGPGSPGQCFPLNLKNWAGVGTVFFPWNFPKETEKAMPEFTKSEPLTFLFSPCQTKMLLIGFILE